MFTKLDAQGVLLEYDLPDLAGGALRTQMRRIKPEVPVGEITLRSSKESWTSARGADCS